MLFGPLVSFDAITQDECNRCLVAWGHRMGPWERPFRSWFWGLRHHGELVGVCAVGELIRERVAGIPREQAVELGRVCASRPGINRVVLRMWREFVLPDLCREHGWSWALSYQDAVLHSGGLYRFDGWVPVGKSSSGTDARSGARGRRKVIWGWTQDDALRRSRDIRATEGAQKKRAA